MSLFLKEDAYKDNCSPSCLCTPVGLGEGEKALAKQV